MTSGEGHRVGFVDSLLPDGSVERVYADGVRERRVAQGPGVVAWSDSRGRRGRDTHLGGGRVRREDAAGLVAEGQQVGNGVTVWEGGRYLTVNETPMPDPPPAPPPRPGGLAGLLIGLGLGGLFGLGAGPHGLDPASGEYALYAEEYARQEALRRGRPASGGGGDGMSVGAWSNDSGDGGAVERGADSFG
jgi:hypothetical protein